MAKVTNPYIWSTTVLHNIKNVYSHKPTKNIISLYKHCTNVYCANFVFTLQMIIILANQIVTKQTPALIILLMKEVRAQMTLQSKREL